MEPPPAVFSADATVSEVIATLRPIVSHTLVTYVFVVDEERRLTGLVAFRELTFASPEQRLSEIMVARPFSLRPDSDVIDAMREVVSRHYPVYPVCDDDGRLLGVVRGAVLFEEQAFEISAQAGSMVGVEKEERLTTPWQRALRFRHPWLQLNLVTAFIAAAVVGMFQDTVNRIVILAVFIPVLSGQCSNTGCQALAVTLRGMTLGELKAGRARALLWKEAWLGFLNGTLTGLVAGVGMFWLAHHQGRSQAFLLAAITFVAMAGSCAMSGLAGAAVPLGLKRLGADPATASSIFLTTATDVVSMGLFLGLAAWLINVA
jgi:magnesium transporter